MMFMETEIRTEWLPTIAWIYLQPISGKRQKGLSRAGISASITFIAE